MLDLKSLGLEGLDLENASQEDEEEAEESEQTAISNTQETPHEQPKAKSQETPKIDKSIPPSERVDKELKALKFESGMLEDSMRYAAMCLARLVKVLFKEPTNGTLEAWDKNNWTLLSLMEAFRSEAQKQAKQGVAVFCGDENDPSDPTMGMLAHLIVDGKKEKPKPTLPTIPKATTKAKPQKEAKPKEAKPTSKSESAKTAEQLLLDLGM